MNSIYAPEMPQHHLASLYREADARRLATVAKPAGEPRFAVIVRVTRRAGRIGLAHRNAAA